MRNTVVTQNIGNAQNIGNWWWISCVFSILPSYIPDPTVYMYAVFSILPSYIPDCGSPSGVMMADSLSFNAKIGLVDFWV